MHEAMMAHMGIGHEQNGAHQESYGNGPSDNWAELSSQYSSHHQSPIHEYGGYSFIQPAPQNMQHEGSYSRMMQNGHHGPHHQHQQLLPLIMPSHPTWPSMLTNPSGGYLQALPIPPPIIPLRTSKVSNVHSNPSPRKTLSDADRRRMCQYHEDNPTTKQTEIGAMFGVERSTVSKVLRNKEKYLFPEDRSTSPVKRVKGKYPDIERALSSWVQKSQSKGILVTDAIIQEKAKFFASAVGSSESHQKANSSSWLEKFKQKNGIGMGRLLRRASETNISDSATYLRPDSISSAAQSPTTGASPSSPSGLSQSPLSGIKNEELTNEEEMRAGSENMDRYIDFAHNFKNHNSHSATSLSSAFTDSAPSSFSGGPTTPTTPFSFPAESKQFLPSQGRLPVPSNHLQRPRSQTFPNLGIDESFMSQVESDSITPKYHNPETSSESQNQIHQNQNHHHHPSPLGSPIHGMSQPFNIQSTISSPILHHSSSNGSMAPPYSTPHTTASSMTSPASSSLPSSPTREDARRALDTLLNFFSQAPMGLVNEKEYMTVVKLTEKLMVNQGNGGAGGGAGGTTLPGGLHRIVEQEGEVLKMESLDEDAQ